MKKLPQARIRVIDHWGMILRKLHFSSIGMFRVEMLKMHANQQVIQGKIDPNPKGWCSFQKSQTYIFNRRVTNAQCTLEIEDDGGSFHHNCTIWLAWFLKPRQCTWSEFVHGILRISIGVSKYVIRKLKPYLTDDNVNLVTKLSMLLLLFHNRVDVTRLTN